MSGTAVIRYLLANAVAVTAVVPAARIRAGELPINTELPGIAVTSISGQPLNFIRNPSRQTITERVQVNVLAHSYPTVKQVLALVLAACPSQRGTVNGVAVIDIVPDFVGPDLYAESINMHSQSRDFFVRWTTA